MTQHTKFLTPSEFEIGTQYTIELYDEKN